MVPAKSFVIGLVVLAWLTTDAHPSSAEWIADLYLGAAITQNEDLSATTQFVLGMPFTPPVGEEFKDLDFDSSVTFGGRFGLWLEAAPFLGLALDVFHFQPDISSQRATVTSVDPRIPFELADFPVFDADIAVTAISFDLMLRGLLLTSSRFPKGQLQPYFTVGPAIFIADVDDTTNFGPPSNQSDTDTSVGVKVGTGLAWQLHKNVALFGEYRFTHFHPKVEFGDPGGKSTAETDLNTHHLITGFSFRF